MLVGPKSSRLAAVVLCLVVSTLAQGDEAAPRQWITFTNELKSGGTGPEMMIMEAGRFRMGCTSGVACFMNEPVREVSITPFALSVYEVTRGEFQRFVEQTGYVTDAERAPKLRPILPFSVKRGCFSFLPHLARINGGFTWKRPNFPQSDEHPVVCVSWADTHAYVQWLAAETGRPYRLPSEAEWEYAARAGASSAELDEEVIQKLLYCAGFRQGDPSTEELEACFSTYSSTAAVGGQGPNAFGLYDMTGNASEIVEDCWHPNFRGAPADGTAWTDKCYRGRGRGRVVRSGELVPVAGAPLEARSSLRRQFSLNLVGFRVALPTSD